MLFIYSSEKQKHFLTKNISQDLFFTLTNVVECDMLVKPHVTGFFKKHSSPVAARFLEKAGPFMFAVIETGGKQYKVQNGDVIYVEKLAAEENTEVTFQVVALGGEGGLKIGTPYVDGASVTGKVLKTGKGKKITVLTYKPKKGSKRKMGHRQPYTKIEIAAING